MGQCIGKPDKYAFYRALFVDVCREPSNKHEVVNFACIVSPKIAGYQTSYGNGES